MSAVDWIFLAIIGVSALFGLMRGFVGVVASLIAWVLAAWTAFRFGGVIGAWLAAPDVPGPGAMVAGYALGFAGVMLVVGLLSMLICRALQSAGLSGVDRWLGLVFGTARGVFIASALVLVLSFTSVPRGAQWQRSAVAPLLEPMAGAMRDWLPTWAAARAATPAPGGSMHDALARGSAAQPAMQAEQAALERALLPVLDAQLRAARGQLAAGASPARAPAPRGGAAAAQPVVAGADPAAIDGLPQPVDDALVDP